jgi:choline-sulfatase
MLLRPGSAPSPAGGEAIVEYYGDGTWRGWRMIRSGDWKLVQVPGTETLLYNLKQDPEEWQNLAGDPRHEGIRRELAARVSAGWNADACDERRWRSQERRVAILQATGRGEPRSWQHPSAPVPHPNPAYRAGASGEFQFSASGGTSEK